MLRSTESRRTIVLCAAIIGLVLVALGTWRLLSGQERAESGIVLIVVDTLRADHLGVYGYPRPTSPHLDRWAQDAAVFDRAFSTSTWTLPAFASLFTGLYPSSHGAGAVVGDAGDDEEQPSEEDGALELVEHAQKAFVPLTTSMPVLALTLRGAGFATGAVVNNPFLHPQFGVRRGFSHYDYDEDTPERPADVSVDRALEWLAERGQEPFFLFLHLMDPHMPYDPPEGVRGRFTSPYSERFQHPIGDARAHHRLRGLIARRNDRARAFYVGAYDEEIAFVDEELGRFFEQLESMELWRRSLVILTSDHGEALFEHGYWEHGTSVSNGVVRVPLLVWGPRVRPGRYAPPVTLADLMPTLLQALEVELPGSVDGISLWPALSGWRSYLGIGGGISDDRWILAEGTLYGRERKALIRWPYKLVANGPGRYYLYDLARDFDETADLAATHPEILRELRAELQRFVAAAIRRRGQQAGGVELDSRAIDNLRALGYIQ